MGDFVITDALLFLDALICGMIIATVYDVLRIFRNIIPHYNIIINIEDFVFWNIAGIYLFAVMLSTNNGVIRGFFLMGAVMGAYVYKKSIGELLVQMLSKGINSLVNIFLKKPINKVIMIFRKRKEKMNGKVCEKKEKGRKNHSYNKKKAV